nr:zinc finger, CCHC-type [Tanacetum cinerariifolium]
MKVDGTIDEFKARLVIQGFRQKEGIDYFDTYESVARITTIKLLLALPAIHNLVIHQMDVKTTFLNGNLDEEVYMKQPKGFVMLGNEHKVCKLVKSLYGLKQAPKQWHQKFSEVTHSVSYKAEAISHLMIILQRPLCGEEVEEDGRSNNVEKYVYVYEIFNERYGCGIPMKHNMDIED